VIESANILSAFGLPEDLLKLDPNALPFAFKKRLGIALSVLFRKSWLIFDEPTLGQDDHFRSALVEFAKLALERGAGIILISHDINFRSNFSAAKKLIVRNGKIADTES
jgi:energy-coupling factor transport system ATP-binding protein